MDQVVHSLQYLHGQLAIVAVLLTSQIIIFLWGRGARGRCKADDQSTPILACNFANWKSFLPTLKIPPKKTSSIIFHKGSKYQCWAG